MPVSTTLVCVCVYALLSPAERIRHSVRQQSSEEARHLYTEGERVELASNYLLDLFTDR
jgi:hypothetical protein